MSLFVTAIKKGGSHFCNYFFSLTLFSALFSVFSFLYNISVFVFHLRKNKNKSKRVKLEGVHGVRSFSFSLVQPCVR